jgi:O-antigen/teichoic acid export membrane protein
MKSREGISELSRQAARAAISNTLFVPTQAILSLAAGAVITRLLGIHLFGLYAIFQALKSTLSFYSDLGSSTATSKLFPEILAAAGRQGAVRLLACQAAVNIGATAILAGVLLLIAPLCLRLFSISTDHEFLIWYACIGMVIEEAGRLGQVFLWARFAHTKVNLSNLAGALAQPLCVLAVVQFGGGLREVVLATLAASTLRTTLMLACATVELVGIPISMPPARQPLRLVRRFVRLAALSWTEKLSNYLYGTSFVTLVIAAIFDKVHVGLFSLAAEFTLKILSFVLSPTHGIILPAFSVVFFEGSSEDRQRVFSASLRIIGMLLAPTGALLIGLAPYLITAFYSSPYAAAAPYVQIFTLFYFTEYAIYAPANATLLAGEQLATYSRIKLLSIAIVPLFMMVSVVASLPVFAVVYGTLRLMIALALLATATRLHNLRVPIFFYASLGGAAAASAFIVTGILMVFGTNARAAAISVIVVAVIMVIGERKSRWIGAYEWSVLERMNLPTASRFARSWSKL